MRCTAPRRCSRRRRSSGHWRLARGDPTFGTCPPAGQQPSQPANGGYEAGKPNARVTPAQAQCVANAQADYNTAVSRAKEDANKALWRTVRNSTVGGAVGGCVSSAFYSGFAACLPAAAIGGFGGFIVSIPFGLFDAESDYHTGVARAKQDYQTQVQRCFQQ
jgi:hypothetical protein